MFNIAILIFVALSYASAVQLGGVQGAFTCSNSPQLLPQVDFTNRFLLTVNVEIADFQNPLNEIFVWRNHGQAGKPNTQVQVLLDARHTTPNSPNWIFFMRSEDGTLYRYDHGWVANNAMVEIGTGRTYKLQLEWNGESVSFFIDGVLGKTWSGAHVRFGKDFTWRRSTCRGWSGAMDFHVDTCGYEQFRGTMVGSSNAFSISEPGHLETECHMGPQYKFTKSLEDCATLCNQNSQCVYFQYGAGAEDCWLFSFPTTCTRHEPNEDYDVYYFQCQEPDVNCVGSWSPFGECSQTCGSGTQTRTFSVTTPKLGFGSSCDSADGATESQACNTHVCEESDSADEPVDAPDSATCSFEQFRGTLIGASSIFTIEEPGFLIAHCHMGDKTFQSDVQSCADTCIQDAQCEYFQYGFDTEECWLFASPMQCTSHVAFEGYDVYHFPSGCDTTGSVRRLLALNQ